MKEIVVDLLEKELKGKFKKTDIEGFIETPSDSTLGDFAFPCFKLSAILKKNPAEIAKQLSLELGKKIKAPIEKVVASGPYLNFFIKKADLATEIIKMIHKEKDKFGSGRDKQKVMIEFPSPNTNKPLHLGHLRNMSLGESISRILEFKGNRVIRANLNNDRGIHICKSMLAYEKWGNNKTPESEKMKSDHLIGDFYVMYSKAAKENPKLEEEAQEMLNKWEKGDKKVIALWKKMNKWALDGFKETYKLFGIKPEKEYYESNIYLEGKELIQEGLKKGIFKKREDGAIVADLNSEKLGEKVMLRADGTSIYITQDMYLAVLKDKEFKLDGSIYVVANEQDYHFKVLFSILKKFGFKFTNNLNHLSYGMVELPEGRMKSREGNVVDADDLILETQKLAEQEIKKRFSQLKKEELQKRSLKISLGAIKFMLLKIDHVKNMVFNPNEAISFEGDTGPYIQYSYARASSIIKKSSKKAKLNIPETLGEKEALLIKKLGDFPEIVQSSYKQLAPSTIANYALELSHVFNEFYHETKVIDSEKEEFLLSLVEAFRIVIKQSLYLLGIEVMEEM